jgi:hypothetical protein
MIAFAMNRRVRIVIVVRAALVEVRRTKSC